MSAHDVMESIYSRWTAQSLTDDVAGGLWLSLAPSGTSFPYAVYDLVSSVPDARGNTTASSGTEIYRIEFQIALYGDTMSEVSTASKAVRAGFDNAGLTLSGGEGDVLQCRCVNETPVKLEDDVWQWVLTYEILRSEPINPGGA